MPINNQTPSIRDLVPELMGGAGPNLIRQDAVRPDTNWLRTAHMSTGVRSTYVIPGDWPDRPDHWFAQDAPTYPLRKQNNVEFFIDGEATFEAMVEAIETATGPDHFIVLLGWACHVDFVLSKKGTRCPGAKRNFFEIIKERVEKGVLVRVLLYPNTKADTDAAGLPMEWNTKLILDTIEFPHPKPPAVSKIRIILDGALKKSGGLGQAQSCHHQKVLIVYGEEGLIGFFGGVDINGDRVNPSKVRMFAGPELFDTHGPLHDVHARARGESAEDLLVLATNRWNFSAPYYPNLIGEAEPDQVGGVIGGATYKTGREMEDMTFLLNRARANRIAPPGPHHHVKVAHTVGNPELAKLQDNGAWPMVRHAIRQAKKFIYMEDQYLWSLDAAEELGKAAYRVSHITILVPPDDQMILDSLRYRALKKMKEVAGEDAKKIGIYVIGEDVHQYIHAKMWIFDDEYALIGSPNCNNRGYFTDSEVNGGIADPDWSSDSGPRAGKWWALDLNFAHKLRIKLWSEHLRIPPEELIDGVAAEVHWRHPSWSSNSIRSARISKYSTTLTSSGSSATPAWHEHLYADYDDYVRWAVMDPQI
ncbi:MAG: phospholipase D-like domain-containing protein [Byssovorax sp.]